MGMNIISRSTVGPEYVHSHERNNPNKWSNTDRQRDIPHDDGKCHIDLWEGAVGGRDSAQTREVGAVGVRKIARFKLNESAVK
jgi:hypothetical protein